MVILLLTSILTAHAICYTDTDIKNNVCWAICRANEYDTGTYEVKTKSCICGQRRKFNEITDKVIKVIPKRQEKEDHYY